MTARPRNKKAVAADVWRLVVHCAMRRFGRTSGILQQLGLTPGHMKALLALDPDEPRPMGSLADAFSCDTSTVTWIVDRLEERGLVERRGLPTDRRVKTVALTPLGMETKAELEKRLYEPPAELLSLDRDVLEALLDVLAKLDAPEGMPDAGDGARTHSRSPRRSVGG